MSRKVIKTKIFEAWVSLMSSISYAATLKMLMSTCLTIFISLSTAKETKDKRSVGKFLAIDLLER